MCSWSCMSTGCNQFKEGIVEVVRVIVEVVKLHSVNNSYYIGYIDRV